MDVKDSIVAALVQYRQRHSDVWGEEAKLIASVIATPGRISDVEAAVNRLTAETNASNAASARRGYRPTLTSCG